MKKTFLILTLLFVAIFMASCGEPDIIVTDPISSSSSSVIEESSKSESSSIIESSSVIEESTSSSTIIESSSSIVDSSESISSTQSGVTLATGEFPNSESYSYGSIIWFD